MNRFEWLRTDWRERLIINEQKKKTANKNIHRKRLEGTKIMQIKAIPLIKR